MQIVSLKPVSVKRIGEVRIYKYDITYRSELGRKHTVRVQILKHKGLKALLMSNELLRHAELIEYLTNASNIITATPKEFGDLIVKLNFS